MTYLDKEIEKCLNRIKWNLRNKKINWNIIRIYLYKLSNKSFKEGVYVGKK